MFSCVGNDWTSKALQALLCIGHLKVLNILGVLPQPYKQQHFLVVADPPSHDVGLYPQQAGATENRCNDMQSQNPADCTGAEKIAHAFDRGISGQFLRQ